MSVAAPMQEGSGVLRLGIVIDAGVECSSGWGSGTFGLVAVLDQNVDERSGVLDRMVRGGSAGAEEG
ncbi:MAG: hypothetical protein ACJ72A_03680 [Nocardioidaceae bacterium]